MATTASTAGRPRRRARPDAWGASMLAVALFVGLPLALLPASFLTDRLDVWRQLAQTILPTVLRNTALLAVGVGAGTLVLGTALAVLVSFYDFPGRRVLDWALILPLAMPGYVLAFVMLGQWDFASPLQEFLRDLFGPGFRLPEIRSAGGAILILTLVLYPYVYLIGRSAFLGQSRSEVEAARSLGSGYLRAVVRVAVPAARPALAAGATLAVMEALADFGTVNLLGFQTFTDAIYRVWYGMFDRAGATQLATLLVSLTLTLLLVERFLRGRARYHQNLARGLAVTPRRLHGWRAALALALPALLLAVSFGAPVLQLVLWAVASFHDGTLSSGFGEAARNSVLFALVAALIACVLATVVVYGLRVSPTRLGTAAARFASIGYGVPGSVAAVSVIVPFAWLDRRLDGAGSLVGADVGLVLTGSAAGLVFAYLVRFLAVAVQTLEAQLGRVPPSLDEAARNLGASRTRVLLEVHLPLLQTGLLTAGLLVFVEVLKELPATMLLRPFGYDTLAVLVWQATSDSLWETAALPALLIVAVGLFPVILVARLSDRRRPAG